MSKHRSAHVFVLGPLTQSPRILSHASFLAQEGWSVTVSGHILQSDSLATFAPLIVRPIPICPNFGKFVFPAVLALFLKFIWISALLTWHLVAYCRSHVLLVQSPPAVPTLFLLWLYVRLTGKQLFIDWHNYGYTLFGPNIWCQSSFSRLYRLFELDFAAKCLSSSNRFHHLCVSASMQRDLENRGIDAILFYDRPSENVAPTTAAIAHELFTRLGALYPCLRDPEGSIRRTRFTEITVLPAKLGGTLPQWRQDRPALIVSSCSWTPDDDFTMALEAFDAYDKEVTKRECTEFPLPHLLFVVTGRGPLKDHYARLIANKAWTHVEVLMPWLEWSDYHIFLGCADLGISLHRSSSGLDLPMKVVDLIGVEVPVLALTYPALYELIPDNKFGAHFQDVSQLTNLLIKLLTRTQLSSSMCSRGLGSSQLERYRNELRDYHKHNARAHAYWRSVALPIFEQASNTGF